MNSNVFKTVIITLISAVLLITLQYYFRFYLVNMNYNIPSDYEISIIITLIFFIVFFMFIFCRKLFLMAKQEQTIATQHFYFGQMQEMIGIIKAQRHDFINHMQIIYTLLQIGEVNRAQDYINELCQEVRVSGELLQIKIPELAALLLAKKSLGVSRNIAFNLIVESDLAKFAIKPIELAAIMGNLIDNALEAVAPLSPEKRYVEMKIYETPRQYVFEVSNPGYIPPSIRDKIFIAGFSTKPDKTGHGIGLASVKHLVEKNRGTIAINSSQDENIKFTVCFSK